MENSLQKPGYQHEIMGSPDYSYLRVTIPGNETLKVEASAMATMDTHISMKTKMKGGFGRMFRGENLFINEFTAQGAPGVMEIAPGPPGDLSHMYLNNETIYLQASSFVAAPPISLASAKSISLSLRLKKKMFYECK